MKQSRKADVTISTSIAVITTFFFAVMCCFSVPCARGEGEAQVLDTGSGPGGDAPKNSVAGLLTGLGACCSSGLAGVRAEEGALPDPNPDGNPREYSVAMGVV